MEDLNMGIRSLKWMRKSNDTISIDEVLSILKDEKKRCLKSLDELSLSDNDRPFVATLVVRHDTIEDMIKVFERRKKNN